MRLDLSFNEPNVEPACLSQYRSNIDGRSLVAQVITIVSLRKRTPMATRTIARRIVCPHVTVGSEHRRFSPLASILQESDATLTAIQQYLRKIPVLYLMKETTPCGMSMHAAECPALLPPPNSGHKTIWFR